MDFRRRVLVWIITHQLPILVVQRAGIGATVIPDRPTGISKILRLAWCESSADSLLLLIASNAAHMPAIKTDRCTAHILEPHHLSGLIDSDDLDGIVRRRARIRIDLTVVERRRRQGLRRWRNRRLGWLRRARGVVA